MTEFIKPPERVGNRLDGLVGHLNVEISKMMQVDIPTIIKRNDTIEYRHSLCVREAIHRRDTILKQMANDRAELPGT